MGGLKKFLMLAALIMSAPAALAEQFIRDGEFIVHYSALNTTQLTPEIARAFNLDRSRNRALLVLNAQRETAPGVTTPIPATATGTARSLIGHEQKLALRKAREGDVHYVLAEFQMLTQEYLVFDVDVLPEGALRPIKVKFTQQFYND